MTQTNTTTNFDALSTTDLAAAASIPAGRVRRNRTQAAAERALVARIEAALHRSPVAVVRALELLYARQTSDEQATFTTRHDNERGFSQSHASKGSWLVTTVIAQGRDEGRSESQLLRGKALEMGRRIALRYARTQLLQVAYEKAAAARNAYVVPPPSAFGFEAPASDVTVASLAAELGDEPATVTIVPVDADETVEAQADDFSIDDLPGDEEPAYVRPAKCIGCQWAGRCENGWVYHMGTEYPCSR